MAKMHGYEPIVDEDDADDEMNDTLVDIPTISYKRRRREAVATAMPRKSTAAENWELTELLEQRNNLLATDKIPDITTPGSDTKGETTQEILSTGEQLTTTALDTSDTKDESSTEADESESESAFLKYAKLVLPHVGLVLLTCTYTLIGASIFYSIERPHEHSSKVEQLDKLYAQRAAFLDLMWNLSQNALSEGAWKDRGAAEMDIVTDELFKSFEKYFLSSTEVREKKTMEIWTFSTAIFFAVTVVTTIGYGNPVPVTKAGRLICIFFALFGIPLTLVTIADIGKFFSEHLVWLYGKYLNGKHTLVRKLSRAKRSCPPKEHDVNHVCHHCKDITPQMVEEKRIPATLVLSILVAYTALGGILMSHLEPWNFFTSFYYSFITMTTVGFGDLMPRRDSYMYLILLYIVIGLAITTMCIDLVGVQYIRKIHYFGRKIQDARSALAVVGGKVVLVSELYANLLQRRSRAGASGDAFIIENLYLTKHLVPYIPRDIRRIRYIDQATDSLSTSTSSMEFHSCKYCHSRFSVSHGAHA